MLEATRRKMYVDSRGSTLNLTDEVTEDIEEEEEGQQANTSIDSCSSLEISVNEGDLPSTFPIELRTIVVPSYWQPSY